MREARATAKPGDIFTPETRPVITRLLATVFGGPDGKQLKASIMDENPVDPVAMKLTVNGRYPDTNVGTRVGTPTASKNPLTYPSGGRLPTSASASRKCLRKYL